MPLPSTNPEHTITSLSDAEGIVTPLLSTLIVNTFGVAPLSENFAIVDGIDIAHPCDRFLFGLEMFGGCGMSSGDDTGIEKTVSDMPEAQNDDTNLIVE